MKIEDVKKMKPIDIFWYWIQERHKIYLAKQNDKPKPWSDDTILQQFFFTNPYRENDKMTVWFRENIRKPLRNDPRVLMATVITRWFNRPDTAINLMGVAGPIHCGDGKNKNLLLHWDEEEAVDRLKAQNEYGAVFTGAFMVKVGNGEAGCKIPQVCSCITELWKDSAKLLERCEAHSLEALWYMLKTYRGLGGFLSYEIVTDLRFTKLLHNAVDIDTWTNPGPGCSRGLNRLAGKQILIPKGGTKDSGRKPPEGYMKTMKELLALSHKKLRGMPRFELREIEHSLCETDKYMRLLYNQGKSKRRYDGTGA